MILAAESAFVDGAFRGPTTLELDGDVLTAVRPWRAGDPKPAAGCLLPGLVNAHLHLELSWAAGRVPAGLGFDGWVQGLLSLERESGYEHGIDQLVRAGTAAVSDICNGPDTAPSLAAAGLCGIVQRELFGLDARRLAGLLERAAEPAVRHGGMVNRPSPHAVYSTPPALLRATIDAEGFGHPASIHVSEDPCEQDFVRDGSGVMGPRLDALGIDWHSWEPPGTTPVQALQRLGLLRDLLLVHAVLVDDVDRAAIADSNCAVVLCPRSNLHIGGRLPDAPALLAAGVPLALGTDSLASCPDLDVLQEVAVLHEAFADVPLATWLHAATAGGADALRVPVGRLQVGLTPKVLLVHPERPWEPREVLVG